MKKIIKSVLVMLFVFTIFYLIGAFFSVSFDISKWEPGCRFFVSMFGGAFSVFSFVFYLGEFND